VVDTHTKQCIIRTANPPELVRYQFSFAVLKLETLYVDDGWIARGGAKQPYAKGEVGVENGLVDSYSLCQAKKQKNF